MSKKIIWVIFWFSLSIQAVNAQDNPSTVKLSKVDKIWLAAYDDTTKALALLFIKKRTQFNESQTPAWFALGASSVIIGTGLLLQDDTQNASYDEGHFFDGVIIFLGAAGLFTSTVVIGAGYIQFHPYTLKKFYKLVELHKSGKPLPGFYLKKMFGRQRQ